VHTSAAGESVIGFDSRPHISIEVIVNLVPHHAAIVAMLQKRTNLRLIAFVLECSSSELRQYIEEHDMDYAPGPTKQYPIHGARWWRPWKANPHDLR